ncbi:RING-finger protein Mag2p [[Candida] railenensis]|uniref:RING-finger protein Mag2p n=1 Tax=[Candida] railenensis TaxID=45579 RepID=A0A9P0QJW0_9ASCO|nr:RING-finger protein Mag2p [[Candida] railenensis]
MSKPNNEQQQSIQPTAVQPTTSTSTNTVSTGAGGKKAKSHNNNRYRDYYKDEDFSERIDKQIKSGKKLHGNSRKNQISINHLLDFQSYEDSQEYQERRKGTNGNQRGGGRRRSSGSNGNSKNRRNPFKVNLHGMSYINCHYKFVVDCRSDYKTQQLDPNVPVTVSDILRIITPKGNACPICLSDDPVAPRMITACGHILCLTCLLSLLDSEVPTSGKKSAGVGEIKYNDCPLCSTIIRQKDIKPVLISNVDERFEVPKVKDEVALTLMTRPQNKLLSLPKNFYDFHRMIDTFPWVHGEDEAGADFSPNFFVYSRFLMGDLNYLIDMYEMEKQLILVQYEQERELYGDDGKYFKLAIENIDKDIEQWKKSFENDTPSHIKMQPQHSNSYGSSSKQKEEQPGSNTFFYYQTGFNASSTFVLSPLDMKVLKHSYNDDYYNLPSSIIAKVENIRYEEFNAELAFTKYKYLSHLPFGTSIGFLECNWSNNEFIQEETWEAFKGDLIQRTKNSNRKFKREETNRRRALNDEEIKNREFYERENNNGVLVNNYGGHNQPYSDYYEDSSNGGSFSSMTRNIGNLSVIDYRDLPVLSSEHPLPVPPLVDGTTESGTTIDSSGGASDEVPGSPKYQTTIWGTKIPQVDQVLNPPLEDSEDDWDAEEMIRRAKEEMDRQEAQNADGSQKKKKKKKILLSSAW